MSSLKQLGGVNFRNNNNLSKAIEYYTWALERPPPNEKLSTEQKRTILANRAQAAIKARRIYTALQDYNTALSSEFTGSDSPKALTAKLHLRRAGLQYKFVEFEDALRDYQEFERLQKEAGGHIVDSDKQLLANITTALSFPDDGPEMYRVKLLRAVQARGIIVSDAGRVNFPKIHVNDEDEPKYDILDFEPLHHLRPLDPITTPLKFPTRFAARSLTEPRDPSRKFTISTNLLEDEPISTAISAAFSQIGVQLGASRDWLMNALELESLQRSSILLFTEAMRFYVIPPGASIRDVYQ
ncbi:hypothetical protein K474DRAFT_1669742 [Panus rudis PR-1116 ss-1]|nr:hypothetical protein K474DRAFT_1669742 [Panus rudis PR-1116 ss-1]